MADHEKDDAPMLSDTHPKLMDEEVDSRFSPIPSRTPSESISITVNSMDSYGFANRVGYTGPLRRERKAPLVQMSGPLYINRNTENLFPANHGVTARKKVEPKPQSYVSFKGMDQNNRDDINTATNTNLMRSGQLGMCNDPYCTTCPSYYHSKDSKFHNVLHEDAEGWTRRFNNVINPYIRKVLNPHNEVENKCIVIDWPMTKTIVFFRSLTDLIYLLNILLQFRLAYVAPESRVVGVGELVDHPKKIAMHYIRGWFFIDLFVVLPLPQIIILVVLPMGQDASGANTAKNLLRSAVLVQNIPKLCRLTPFFIGRSPSGFIFETALANFIINLFTYMLSGHIVGSCWYLFGLQRVNQCLHDACHNTGFPHQCLKFLDCGRGNVTEEYGSDPNWYKWTHNSDASKCFQTGGPTTGFDYGIYAKAVNLTGKNVITRYIYSLFWGFQQISTLAGNQVPSYFVWEVLFTMAIVGLGLLLFALLIGNMQNFLQSLGRRRSEMSLRQRDIEQWMRHRYLPQELRRRVLEAERYHWAVTRGVNERMLMENLPEDLQREIRRHLFELLKKVSIFNLMDDHVLDVVWDVCGEELLTWFLEHSLVSKDGRRIKTSGQYLISSRTVMCRTNVEAFSLSAADLEEVTSIFARHLRNPLVQGAIRYRSPYWRARAANIIQVAWRYRKKCLRNSSKGVQSNHSSNSRV
ncbi:CYCLIC NUCLEOTIDE-GATED ION CHANNEL 20 CHLOROPLASTIC-RELATED [Salix koriyanagi]|uniref:CYCLIC NUCLEOTIDE-GATED ION CHANNEL 20 CHLOROPLASTIC-RELATED n=1 Tax=Salix koriyanagi TaxID=2511006 RepID=A0A9Q1ABD4_9ROSI|nr:CYCLIC NUCLEOTIDE-GATED ION CHANNEL 20 CHLOROPLASTIC-RELATED [Salix koriyanagi]